MDHVQREAERKKYIHVYATEPKYVISPPRLTHTEWALKQITERGSLVDIGCGTGVVMERAERLGFNPVHGVDFVESLCDGVRVMHGHAHQLPLATKSFDTAIMLDVIEHLIPGDDELACHELGRVAKKTIIISASNIPSVHNGWDLHINKREYGDWHVLFMKWLAPKNITLYKNRFKLWRIDL